MWRPQWLTLLAAVTVQAESPLSRRGNNLVEQNSSIRDAAHHNFTEDEWGRIWRA